MSWSWSWREGLERLSVPLRASVRFGRSVDLPLAFLSALWARPFPLGPPWRPFETPPERKSAPSSVLTTRMLSYPNPSVHVSLFSEDLVERFSCLSGKKAKAKGRTMCERVDSPHWTRFTDCFVLYTRFVFTLTCHSSNEASALVKAASHACKSGPMMGLAICLVAGSKVFLTFSILVFLGFHFFPGVCVVVMVHPSLPLYHIRPRTCPCRRPWRVPSRAACSGRSSRGP